LDYDQYCFHCDTLGVNTKTVSCKGGLDEEKNRPANPVSIVYGGKY
jgi:hypothetical protein